MLKKEYIVFTAFLLVNVLLALNCLTDAALSKRDYIKQIKYQEITPVIKIDKREFRSSDDLATVPDVSAIWDNKNQIQISFFYLSQNHFCIQILDNKDNYLNPDIKNCEEIKKENLSPFYRVQNKFIMERIIKRLPKIEEFVFNTNRPGNFVFILKDKSYIYLRYNKILEGQLKAISREEPVIERILDNKEGVVIRKKINSILTINVFSTKENYISFFYNENAKNRSILVEWEIEEYLKETRIPKYILLTLLLPFTFILDLALLPFTVILYILVIIQWRKTH